MSTNESNRHPVLPAVEHRNCSRDGNKNMSIILGKNINKVLVPFGNNLRYDFNERIRYQELDLRGALSAQLVMVNIASGELLLSSLLNTGTIQGGGIPL